MPVALNTSCECQILHDLCTHWVLTNNLSTFPPLEPKHLLLFEILFSVFPKCLNPHILYKLQRKHQRTLNANDTFKEIKHSDQYNIISLVVLVSPVICPERTSSIFSNGWHLYLRIGETTVFYIHDFAVT